MLFLQMWNVTEYKPENYENYQTPKSDTLHRELGFVIPCRDSPYDHEDVGKKYIFIF